MWSASVGSESTREASATGDAVVGENTSRTARSAREAPIAEMSVREGATKLDLSAPADCGPGCCSRSGNRIASGRRPLPARARALHSKRLSSSEYARRRRRTPRSRSRSGALPSSLLSSALSRPLAVRGRSARSARGSAPRAASQRVSARPVARARETRWRESLAGGARERERARTRKSSRPRARRVRGSVAAAIIAVAHRIRCCSSRSRCR